MRGLVILPTYQEAANIEEVLERTRVALPDADILVIDDGSPDGTADLAEAAGQRLGSVSVVRRHKKLGLGTAYLAGFEYGIEEGYELVFEMDSDLSHLPEDLVDLTAEAARGADLVIGSRYVPGGSIPDWPWSRRALSRLANIYAAVALRLPCSDSTAGFRCYRTTILQKIDRSGIRSEGYGFQIEMVYRIARAGGRITEVPITFRDRVSGTSKMSGRIVLEALTLVTGWGIRDRARYVASRVHRARWRDGSRRRGGQ